MEKQQMNPNDLLRKPLKHKKLLTFFVVKIKLIEKLYQYQVMQFNYTIEFQCIHFHVDLKEFQPKEIMWLLGYFI